MPSCPVHAAALACHPESPGGGAIRSIEVRVVRSPGGMLAATFILAGDLDRVRVPAPRPPRIAARLWQHTCCEIFIARQGLAGYHEFNLSSSGEWAVHVFERYRTPSSGRPDAEALDPQISVRGAAGKLELDALIRLGRVSTMHCGARLSLALSAVVEDQEGMLSYWALKHPPGKPDFHHADGFALELEPQINTDEHG